MDLAVHRFNSKYILSPLNTFVVSIKVRRYVYKGKSTRVNVHTVHCMVPSDHSGCDRSTKYCTCSLLKPSTPTEMFCCGKMVLLQSNDM